MLDLKLQQLPSTFRCTFFEGTYIVAVIQRRFLRGGGERGTRSRIEEGDEGREFEGRNRERGMRLAVGLYI